MLWIIVLVVAFFLFRSFVKYSNHNNLSSKRAYYNAPDEIKVLIDIEAAEELAGILVLYEKNGQINEALQVLNAINSKGLIFASKVDKYRSPLREAAGLGKLRMFK